MSKWLICEFSLFNIIDGLCILTEFTMLDFCEYCHYLSLSINGNGCYWIITRKWYMGQVRSRNCGCLVTWFCYQLIAKPGNKTAAVSWPDPYVQMIRIPQDWNTTVWCLRKIWTHLPLDKMVATSQMAFSNAFSKWKVLCFDSNFTEGCF